jgi:hypothetical protein
MGENDDLSLRGFFDDTVGDVLTTLVIERRDWVVENDSRVIVPNGELGKARLS